MIEPTHCPLCKEKLTEDYSGEGNTSRMVCKGCVYLDIYQFCSVYVCGAWSSTHVTIGPLELELNILGKMQYLHKRQLVDGGSTQTQQTTLATIPYLSDIDLTSKEAIEQHMKVLATYL